MKKLFFISLCLILFSCTENDTKKDTETNTYYSKYLYIYNNYNNLGVEKSIELIDEYIDEFPNAENGYKFKAWLLANNGKVNEIDQVLTDGQQNSEIDETYYAYWASLLLKDTNNIEEAKRINDLGLRMNNQNLMLHHNITWMCLFENKNELALNNAIEVCNKDSSNTYLYNKVALIASISSANDSVFKQLSNNFNFQKNDSIEIFLYKENKSNLTSLYNKPF